MKRPTPKTASAATPQPASKPAAPDTNTVSSLHPNNPHQGRYDLAALVQALPELAAFLIQTPKGETSVDFGNAKAVVCLNRALLKRFYGIEHWTLPKGFLCPPIPGRADYVHHAADLLQQRPVSRAQHTITALDIGTGANLIYPIIATQALHWQVVGSDISSAALNNAQAIIDHNPQLATIQLRLQDNAQQVFTGIVRADDYFDITLCNPPFFKSAAEAASQAQRKWRNLKGAKSSSQRNFGGQNQELWCDGGELAFLNRMATESVLYAQQVGWFTVLVSNQDHVPVLQKILRKLGASDIRVVAMAQGQKNSRFVAWRFEQRPSHRLG